MIDKNNFERHLRAENLSENTISSYLFAVNQYDNQYDDITLKNLGSMIFSVVTQMEDNTKYLFL